MKKGMNLENAKDNLLTIKKAMDEANIPFWITAGILLGFYRDNNFIKNDNDLDLGVFIEDFKEKIFLDKLKKYDFKIVRKVGIDEKDMQYVVRKNKIEIDFYFFYTKRKKMYYTAHFRTGPAKFRYTRQEMRSVKIYEKYFLVPKDTELYLKEHYGKNWKIPNKKWTWLLSCNITKTNLKNWLRIGRQWVLFYLRIL